MKQSLLDSLKGKSLNEAKSLVAAAGHKTMTVEDSCAIALRVYENTVIVFYNDKDIVTGVMPGDPLKVVK